jgi:hypothetical protein
VISASPMPVEHYIELCNQCIIIFGTEISQMRLAHYELQVMLKLNMYLLDLGLYTYKCLTSLKEEITSSCRTREGLCRGHEGPRYTMIQWRAEKQLVDIKIISGYSWSGTAGAAIAARRGNIGECKGQGQNSTQIRRDSFYIVQAVFILNKSETLW